MSLQKELTGKVLYALLFLLALPAGLIAWAHATESWIRFPALHNELAAWLFGACGCLLMGWGMWALKQYGKGLPMNAFPPPQWVQEGPYRIFRHPIYWGFGFLTTAISLFTGSASGLWMVLPLTILGMIALVIGFEQPSLEARFPGKRLTTVFDLPPASVERPTRGDRYAVMNRLSFAYAIWLVLDLTLNRDVVTPEDSFLYALIASAVVLSTLTYLFPTRKSLREWTVSSTVALGCFSFCLLLYPKPGSLISLAVPLAVLLLALQSMLGFRKGGLALYATGLAILAFQQSLLASGATWIQGILAWGIYTLATFPQETWEGLRIGAERIANSWKEWVFFGTVRVINHGFYIAATAFFGIFVAGILSGSNYAWSLLVVCMILVVTAALWAQFVEGSEKLKRPFGYYGALAGLPLASMAVWWMGANVWTILAVISVIAPWVQGIGRFRCLVNGCCHGKPVDDPGIGIRYFHPRSRVCHLSGMKGQYLHPTQLYSVLWLFLVGIVTFSLWFQQYGPTVIFGLYLVLTGMGRFVEEAYRGEIQTTVWKGLRLYQWTAILTVLVGILMTCLPAPMGPVDPGFSWQILLSALIGSVFAGFAMGVDFPRSNARFSRLV